MTNVLCRCGAVQVEISAEPMVRFSAIATTARRCTRAAYAPEYRLSGRRRKGGPWRPDDVETEAKSTLRFPRMRYAPVHQCRRPGRCTASMDTCSAASSSPRFTCNADSRSGRSSMTCRITNAEDLSAQLRRSGWVVELRLHRRHLSCPRKRASATLEGINPRFLGNDDTAGCDRSESASGSRACCPIRARPGSGLG